MRTMWIVIADAGRARIFAKTEGSAELALNYQFDNAAGRARDSELESDSPGRFEKHASHIRSAMDPPTDPHEQAAVQFSQRLIFLLDTARRDRAFDALAIFAPAHFLGLLREQMKPALESCVAYSFPKDLTMIDASRLATHLAALRFPAAQRTSNVRKAPKAARTPH